MKTRTNEFNLTWANLAITNSTLHLSLMNKSYAVEPKFIITILGSTLNKKNASFFFEENHSFVLNEEAFKYHWLQLVISNLSWNINKQIKWKRKGKVNESRWTMKFLFFFYCYYFALLLLGKEIEKSEWFRLRFRVKR